MPYVKHHFAPENSANFQQFFRLFWMGFFCQNCQQLQLHLEYVYNFFLVTSIIASIQGTAIFVQFSGVHLNGGEAPYAKIETLKTNYGSEMVIPLYMR